MSGTHRQNPKQPASEAVATPRQVHVIHATAVYSTDDARTILHLKASSLRREIREGRLAVAKRCGRHYFLGSMLLDWLKAGTIRRQRRPYSEDAA